MDGAASDAVKGDRFALEDRDGALVVSVYGVVSPDALGAIVDALELQLATATNRRPLVWDLRGVTRFSPAIMPQARRAVGILRQHVSCSPAITSSAAIRLAVAALQLSSSSPAACFESEGDDWAWTRQAP